MGWTPEYEGASVWRVIVYVVAYTGESACSRRKASAKRPERPRALGG
jgi:hypothetical protein